VHPMDVPSVGRLSCGGLIIQSRGYFYIGDHLTFDAGHDRDHFPFMVYIRLDPCPTFGLISRASVHVINLAVLSISSLSVHPLGLI